MNIKPAHTRLINGNATRDDYILLCDREKRWDNVDSVLNKEIGRATVYLIEFDYFKYHPNDIITKYHFDYRPDANNFETLCMNEFDKVIPRILWDKRIKEECLKNIKNINIFSKIGVTQYNDVYGRFSEVRNKNNWHQKPGVGEMYHLSDIMIMKDIMDKLYKDINPSFTEPATIDKFTK